jgi:hypothetical protein
LQLAFGPSAKLVPGVGGVVDHLQKSQLGGWLWKFWTQFVRRNCRSKCGVCATLFVCTLSTAIDMVYARIYRTPRPFMTSPIRPASCWA